MTRLPEEQKKKLTKTEKSALAFQKMLAQFETAVRGRDYAAAGRPLHKLLEKLEGQTWTFGETFADPDARAERDATRLAAALTAMLVDPDHHIRRQLFFMLCRYKRTVVQIYEVSGYGGTEHLAQQFGEETDANVRGLKSHEPPKLLAGLSINAMTDELLTMMMKLDPSFSFALALGFLSEQMLFTPRAERIRSRLLSMSRHWRDLEANRYWLLTIGPAYMGCSYATAAHKHDIKQALNSVVRRWLMDKGVTDTPLPPVRKTVKDRPTVLIVAELYNKTHAMHRCYGPSIRALKSRFHTVMMIEKAALSPEIEDMVHEVDTTDFSFDNVGAFFDAVKAHKPDILYMPSVGMRLKSIALSVMRLAPLQMLTFGHPATTQSPNMDYVVVEDGQIGSADTVTETLVLRTPAPLYSDRDDAKRLPPDIRLAPDTVRIAVPAWSRKLTPKFLSLCSEIRRRAARPVEFYFFPNAAGALHQAIQKRLVRVLDAVVYPRTDYNVYSERLNECDIFLSSFPFGATNSLVDASLLGLPIVNLWGPETHSANDGHLVSRLRQPKWLTARTEEDFIAAAVRLVDDHALRVQISRNILDGSPGKAFFADGDTSADEFADIVTALYRHHEYIQSSGRHVWRTQDLEYCQERPAHAY